MKKTVMLHIVLACLKLNGNEQRPGVKCFHRQFLNLYFENKYRPVRTFILHWHISYPGRFFLMLDKTKHTGPIIHCFQNERCLFEVKRMIIFLRIRHLL